MNTMPVSPRNGSKVLSEQTCKPYAKKRISSLLILFYLKTCLPVFKKIEYTYLEAPVRCSYRPIVIDITQSKIISCIYTNAGRGIDIPHTSCHCKIHRVYCPFH